MLESIFGSDNRDMHGCLDRDRIAKLREDYDFWSTESQPTKKPEPDRNACDRPGLLDVDVHVSGDMVCRLQSSPTEQYGQVHTGLRPLPINASTNRVS